jgi:hypothetical protein
MNLPTPTTNIISSNPNQAGINNSILSAQRQLHMNRALAGGRTRRLYGGASGTINVAGNIVRTPYPSLSGPGQDPTAIQLKILQAGANQQAAAKYDNLAYKGGKGGKKTRRKRKRRMSKRRKNYL